MRMFDYNNCFISAEYGILRLPDQLKKYVHVALIYYFSLADGVKMINSNWAGLFVSQPQFSE